MGTPRRDGFGRTCEEIRERVLGLDDELRVVASSEVSTDYGFVGVRVGQIAAWHIDGMFDPSVAAALAADLQALEGEDGP